MNKYSNTETLVSNLAQLQHLIDQDNRPLDEKTGTALNELSAILSSDTGELGPDEITEIGELGAGLLQNLYYDTLGTSQAKQQQHRLYNQIALAFGYWVALNKGTLKQIEHPVNALAQIANTLHDKTNLEALYEVAAYLVSATDVAIKKAPDNPPGSPWHTLVMNYGIIATRSHNPDLMNSAFSSLLTYFPEAAPEFFKQGMSEMVRLNYPEHVRAVMRRYHDKYF